VDDLEAVLPAVGVILPPKSQLKGGTLAVNFRSSAPVDKLVERERSECRTRRCPALAWARRCPLSPRSAARWGEKDTIIQNFSANVHATPASTRADNINLAVPSLGTVTERAP